MGPTVIYYHVIDESGEFNWTHKDCPKTMTVGYNGFRCSDNVAKSLYWIQNLRLLIIEIQIVFI